MTAEDIIRQARQEGPAFTADRHPPSVAIDRLSRIQRRLVAEWTKRDSSAYVSELEITFPLDDFGAGVELDDGESEPEPLDITAFHDPFDLYVKGDADRPHDLPLIDRRERNRSTFTRGCWIQGSTLYFTGRKELWSDVERVVVTYTATPPDIESKTETLVLPITAEEALVTALAAFFASRTPNAELTKSRREYMKTAVDAEALWLSEISRRRGAVSSRTRMVW